MSDVNKKDPIQGDIIHEYDGIEEADNGIPHWLSILFYGSMVFAVGYWFYYHEYEVGLQPKERYAAQMAAEAEKGGEVSEELLTTLADDPDAVAEGEQAFQANCAQCHGPNGGGKIGPNLTDSSWIHGGAPTDIYSTIADGVGAKGMPAWSGPLGAEGVQRVTAYVLSIRGTDVEGGKEPEGEEWSASGGPTGTGGAAEGEGSETGEAEAPQGDEGPQESDRPEGAEAPDGTQANDESADAEETVTASR